MNGILVGSFEVLGGNSSVNGDLHGNLINNTGDIESIDNFALISAGPLAIKQKAEVFVASDIINGAN